jgi:3-hydroxybutyryl-CoA dehydrogenase
MSEHLGIAGSGVIACGLAATAAAYTGEPVTVWARSPQSAERAFARITNLCQRFEPPAATAAVTMTTSHEGLAEATFVVEAIAEVLEEKTALLQALAPVVSEDAILASTTSSLSIEALATASGAPERFLGFHVFNPVTRMELVELVFPAQAAASTQARARDLCASLGKTAIEVPNTPGFVVNALLFPFLFHAVELLERTGISAQELDDCMCLGAGHPVGPLAVIDLVGIDVCIAIGERLGADVPSSLYERVAVGALGRKSGRGFHDYDDAPATR